MIGRGKIVFKRIFYPFKLWITLWISTGIVCE